MTHEHERPVFGCEGCIDAANVGTTIEDAKVYRFEIERSYFATIYIAAASADLAWKDADEVAGTLSITDLDADDDSVYLLGEVERPKGEPVWVGGPKGGWE